MSIKSILTLLLFSCVGEGPTNSTGISTQTSQSLGLPVTPSPDPGSSEEKNHSPGTDHVQTNILFCDNCMINSSFYTI